MINVVKKISYIFLFILVFIIGVDNVLALTISKSSQNVSSVHFYQNDSLQRGRIRSIYDVRYSTSDGGIAYCLDPGLAGPSGHSYTVHSSSTDAAYMAGQSYIVTNGGNSLATQIAVRFLALDYGYSAGGNVYYNKDGDQATITAPYEITLGLIKSGKTNFNVATTDGALYQVDGSDLQNAVNLYLGAKGAVGTGGKSGSSSGTMKPVLKITANSARLTGLPPEGARLVSAKTTGGAKVNVAIGTILKNGSLPITRGPGSFCINLYLDLGVGDVFVGDSSSGSIQNMLATSGTPGGGGLGNVGTPVSDCYNDVTDICDPTTNSPGVCPRDSAVGARYTFTMGDQILDEPIKSCVSLPSGAESFDALKNSYTLYKNDYCRISCGEKYTFDMPGNLGEVYAGHWFKLPEPKAVGLVATRVCVSSDINRTLFESKLYDRNTIIANLHKDYMIAKKNAENLDKNKTTSYTYLDANGDTQEVTCSTPSIKKYTFTCYTVDSKGNLKSGICSGGGESWGGHGGNGNCLTYSITDYAGQVADKKQAVQSNMDDVSIFTSIRNCVTGWNNKMEIGPEIIFEYDKGDQSYSLYQKLLDNNGALEWTKTGGGTSVNGYCPKITDNYYNGNCPGTYKNLGYAQLGFSGDDMVNNVTTASSIPNVLNVKKIVTITGHFTAKTKFYTKHPTGKITNKDEGKTTTLINGNGLVYPVAATTEPKTYDYTLTLKNIGMKIDGELGRLTDIYEASFNIQPAFSCMYKVLTEICPDECPPSSDRPSARNYFYRTISLNDVFPNSKRTMGKNWTSAKGKETIKEIEGAGETIYETQTPEYSFTLTPGNMAKIREEVNAPAEANHNGYANFDMKCNTTNTVTDSNNKKIDKKGTECISNFLKDGEKKGYFTVNDSQYKNANRNPFGKMFTHWSDGTSWK